MNPNTLRKPLTRKPQITTAEVESLLAMRETQNTLRDRLAVMDEAIKKSETALLGQIESGADLSGCRYSVNVEEFTRRYPAWKEHFISRLGKSEADAVMDSTAPVILRKLVIK